MKLCIPIIENRFLGSEISGHFGKAPAYLLVETSGNEVAGLLERGARGKEACAPVEAMVKSGVEAVVCGGLGAGAMERLGSAGIHVYQTSARTVEEMLEEFVEGNLRAMEPARLCAGHHNHGAGHGHC